MSKQNIDAFAETLQNKVKASMEKTSAAVIAEVKPEKKKVEKKFYNFALRIDGDVYEKLLEKAAEEEISLNKAINKAIKNFIK